MIITLLLLNNAFSYCQSFYSQSPIYSDYPNLGRRLAPAKSSSAYFDILKSVGSLCCWLENCPFNAWNVTFCNSRWWL